MYKINKNIILKRFVILKRKVVKKNTSIISIKNKAEIFANLKNNSNKIIPL